MPRCCSQAAHRLSTIFRQKSFDNDERFFSYLTAHAYLDLVFRSHLSKSKVSCRGQNQDVLESNRGLDTSASVNRYYVRECCVDLLRRDTTGRRLAV